MHLLRENVFQQMNYDVLSDKVARSNANFLRLYAVSPTIAEISQAIGASEESILESMEFGRRHWE